MTDRTAPPAPETPENGKIVGSTTPIGYEVHIPADPTLERLLDEFEDSVASVCILSDMESHELNKLKAEVRDAREALKSYVRTLSRDDPDMDGTDFAHPAWWRGNDRGVEATVEALNRVLDDPSREHHFGSATLTALAARIVRYVRERTLTEDEFDFMQRWGYVVVNRRLSEGRESE